MTKYNYAEELKAEYDTEIQSAAFGFNLTLSIKFSTCDYHNKDHNDVSNQGKSNMDFPTFSDDYAQNAATTF